MPPLELLELELELELELLDELLELELLDDTLEVSSLELLPPPQAIRKAAIKAALNQIDNFFIYFSSRVLAACVKLRRPATGNSIGMPVIRLLIRIAVFNASDQTLCTQSCG